MKREKMHRIVVYVPTWVFIELQRVANEREWPISHLVRFLVYGCLDAWELQVYENENVYE